MGSCFFKSQDYYEYDSENPPETSYNRKRYVPPKYKGSIKNKTHIIYDSSLHSY